MAQTSVVYPSGGIGGIDRLKIAVMALTNSAAETTWPLTPAMVGMSAFVAVIPIDESAAGATNIRVAPGARTNGVFVLATLTFTAGDEVTILCIGV